MKLNSRGFTLLELLIGAGLGIVIIGIGASLYLGSLGAYVGMQSRSSLAQDAVLMVDYLRNELLVAGGGSARSWMGIWVEDNCGARGPYAACGGSDRLTISKATIPLQECAVTAQPSATVFQIAFTSPGVCCLTPGVGEASYLNKSVIVTLDGNFTNRFVTAVDEGTCRITTKAGVASGWDQTGGTVNWSSGNVTMVSAETLYLDKATNQLMRFIDATADDVVDPGELQIVAIGVMDFQVALGYDFIPADGNISASADGSADEWLYNFPAEAYGAGSFTGSSFTRSALLMVAAGVILGVPDVTVKNAAQTQRIFNGAEMSRVGWTYQSAIAKLAPRNSFIFQ